MKLASLSQLFIISCALAQESKPCIRQLLLSCPIPIENQKSQTCILQPKQAPNPNQVPQTQKSRRMHPLQDDIPIQSSLQINPVRQHKIDNKLKQDTQNQIQMHKFSNNTPDLQIEKSQVNIVKPRRRGLHPRTSCNCIRSQILALQHSSWEGESR